jgi:ubiquinone/menaquinone biosynthesis C-methylase UbiE
MTSKRNSTLDYARYVGQIISGFRVQHEQHLAEWRERDVSLLLDLDRSQRVLDLANGRLRPQYRIMRAAGQSVFGIDLVNHPVTNWVDASYRLARWFYRRQLRYTAADDTLSCANVNRLPFAAETFGLVTSIAAFEHFLDVPTVVAELYRVTRPGGLAWIEIHPFSSPSGGHNVKLSEVPLRHLPRGVDAWDHLRQRRLPFHVPLNEWRIDQYLAEFSKHFEIVKHYCAMREGEELLTPEIERELSAYTRDELTCGAYVIVARKA